MAALLRVYLCPFTCPYSNGSVFVFRLTSFCFRKYEFLDVLPQSLSGRMAFSRFSSVWSFSFSCGLNTNRIKRVPKRPGGSVRTGLSVCRLGGLALLDRLAQNARTDTHNQIYRPHSVPTSLVVSESTLIWCSGEIYCTSTVWYTGLDR